MSGEMIYTNFKFKLLISDMYIYKLDDAMTCDLMTSHFPSERATVKISTVAAQTLHTAV